MPASIAILTRLFSLFVIGLLGAGQHARGATPWTVWDAAWYLGVANNGYHGARISGGVPVSEAVPISGSYDFAFFPAWPAVLSIPTRLGISGDIAAVVIANALFVAALVLTWRVIDRRFDRDAATGSIVLLGLAPPAFVFSLGYAESLFLLAAAGYFAAPKTSRWRLVGAALAVFTRLAGLAVVGAAVVEAWRSHGAERRTALAAVAAGGVALVAWWLFVAVLTAEPLGYLKGTPAWFHDEPLRVIRATLREHPIRVLAWTSFVALMAIGTVLLVRRHPDLFVFTALVIGAGLLPVIGGGILHSLPRYAAVAFPAYAAIAARLGRRGWMPLGIAFAIAQIAFAYWVIPLKGTNAP